MWSVIFEYIGAFIMRPKIVEDSSDFERQKSELQIKISKIIDKGRLIQQTRKELEIDRLRHPQPTTICGKLLDIPDAIHRFRLRKKNLSEQYLFENNCNVAEHLFQQLDKVTNYEDRVEPLKYWGYLAFGCFMVFMNFFMSIHIWKNILVMVDKKPVSPWLNTPLIYINESYWHFLAIVLISCAGFYFLYCAHQGHNKFG